MFTSANALYESVYQTVRSWPLSQDEKTVNIPCKSLNAFAVLQSQAQLNQGALGKEAARYKDKNTFYSRTWENGNFEPEEMKLDLPAVVLVHNRTVKQVRKGYADREYMVMVLDHMPGKDGSQHRECGLRTIEEVMDGTENMLMQFLEEMEQWFTGTNDQDEQVLAHRSAAGFGNLRSRRQCFINQQIEITTLVGQYNADLVSSTALVKFQIVDCPKPAIEALKGETLAFPQKGCC